MMSNPTPIKPTDAKSGHYLVSINGDSIGEPKCIESVHQVKVPGIDEPCTVLTVWFGDSMVEISILANDRIEVKD